MKDSNSIVHILLAILAIIVAVATPEIRSMIFGNDEKNHEEHASPLKKEKEGTYEPEFQKSQGSNSSSIPDKQSIPVPKYKEEEHTLYIDKEENNKLEDYASYINKGIGRSDVSVIVLDKNNNTLNAVASEIAKIYRLNGNNASIGLIRTGFFTKPQFRELQEGNSEVIDKLNISSYTDYLVIGTISYAFRSGKLVEGTIVCNASMSVTIISTQNKSIEQSFAISNAIGNGADKSQAQEEAHRKLIGRYYQDHSSL